jgi:MFS family permease
MSRLGASLAFMMYAGALPILILAWNMNASQAGLVQSTFNISYASSLVVTGWLSDRYGSKKIFLWSSWLSALTGICVALLARSFPSGLLLFSALGLSLGGTYAPSIMLVAENTPSARRGRGVGLMLAGASLGYAGSIALSNAHLLTDYRVSFFICGIAPTVAAIAALYATRAIPNFVHPRSSTHTDKGTIPWARRESLLLTFGYTAHCWELLGMWAWMPAFLAMVFSSSQTMSGTTQGIWIGMALHLSGCISAFTMGSASDHFGRRNVLISLAVLGAACSFAIGWLYNEPAPLVLVVAAIYGFAALGDSPVLSTAMTESVPKGSLGSALALRSILGFGAGGVAPFAFGLIRDVAPTSTSWASAFAILGIGGLLAAGCAMLLPRKARNAE